MDAVIVVAAIGALGGIASTWLTVRGNKQLRPSNGSTVAQTVEKMESKVNLLVDLHLDPKRHP